MSPPVCGLVFYISHVSCTYGTIRGMLSHTWRVMACGPEAMAEDKQIGNTRTTEVFFVAALLSPLSARSLLSLSLSLSLFRCHFLRRCAAALLWTYAEWILCDLVSTLSVAFSFLFFVWKISPHIYGFSFFFAFCVCL